MSTLGKIVTYIVFAVMFCLIWMAAIPLGMMLTVWLLPFSDTTMFIFWNGVVFVWYLVSVRDFIKRCEAEKQTQPT